MINLRFCLFKRINVIGLMFGIPEKINVSILLCIEERIKVNCMQALFGTIEIMNITLLHGMLERTNLLWSKG